MIEQDFAAPPFSRLIPVDAVGEGGQRVKFAASAGECASLAEQDGLEGLRDLAVEAEILRRGRDRFLVRGQVSALVTQTCVVTLEAFEQRVEEKFELEFAPEAEAEAAYLAAMAEIEAAKDKALALASQPDPPDPIRDGRIDLGAIASEFLALGLDPHPRKPGAAFHDIVDADGAEKPSPFAALAKLKKD